jgi:flagellar motility protein MotE (MotC chaperone)
MPEKENKKKKKGFSGFVIVVASILIIAGVLMGFFFIIIKNNVNGIADKYRETIHTIPVLSKALPEVPDPDDPKFMSEKQIRDKYIEYRDLSKELIKRLEDSENTISALAEENNNLKSETEAVDQRKEELEKREKQLEESMDEFALLAAEGNVEGFKQFYEELEPDIASEIYKKIVTDEKADVNAIELALYYENMKPSKAAGILEEQGISERENIIKILVSMDREASAKILSEMSEDFSAKLAKELAEYYLSDNDGQT